MEQLGPAADSRDISGSMDVNGLVQMLTGQSRENKVAIMDVAMPAPSLTGIYVCLFTFWLRLLILSCKFV